MIIVNNVQREIKRETGILSGKMKHRTRNLPFTGELAEDLEAAEIDIFTSGRMDVWPLR